MNPSIRSQILLVLSTVAMLFVGADITQANPTPSINHTYQINSITYEPAAGTFTLTIKGDNLPTYTQYELFNPLRIVVDIADAKLPENKMLPLHMQQGPVNKVTGQLLEDKEPFVSRLEIFLQDDREYTVTRNKNDIVVKFASQATATTTSKTILEKIEVTKTESTTRIYLRSSGSIDDYQEAKLAATNELPARFYIDIENIGMADVPQQIEVGGTVSRIRTARHGDGLRIVFDSGLDNNLFSYDINTQKDGLLISIPDQDSSLSPTQATETKTVQQETMAQETESEPSSPFKKASATNDQFGFSGYNTQRITVDFFKIDLHNVFRLLGEISGRNMIIEESVGGTLTLALTEVPWDFVLDVILNLKDLQKEERFNTIVISPKSKGFTWPERASDKLAIRSDGLSATPGQDSLSVKNRIETPKGVLEAKQTLQLGNEKYANGDFTGALADYEMAASKWPENSQLAKRIAALCLVQLGQNAKAVHYAKLALKTTPGDYEAALQAAIGLANMKKSAAAKQYFDLAVSGPQPSSEALTSYAAFSEENENYVATLLLLTKDTDLYGDSMETMLSKARIYDKQGDKDKAAKEYQALLLSGYDIPADLTRYIKGRLSLTNKQ